MVLPYNILIDNTSTLNTFINNYFKYGCKQKKKKLFLSCYFIIEYITKNLGRSSHDAQIQKSFHDF